MVPTLEKKFCINRQWERNKKMGLEKQIGDWFASLCVHSKEHDINNMFCVHVTDSRTLNNLQFWYQFCNMLCRSALQEWFQGEADLC